MSETGVNTAKVPHHVQVWEFSPPPLPGLALNVALVKAPDGQGILGF